jgi:predicted TPR repeat methyltransferase
VAAFRAASDADRDDYHGARLHLARLGAGEGTPAMTATYVRRLFDQHAPDFDEALLQRLDYRGPGVLLEALRMVAGPSLRFGSALDLGCGTGLAGVAIRPFCGRLVGMDLSAGMLEQARARSIYQRLETAELSAFLEAESERYDLVLAADVFVYCGDLAPIVTKAAEVMAPGGLLAFTVETHDGSGVLLQPTLRYAHGAAHLRTATEAAGLELCHLKPASTRREKGEWVPGMVAVAVAPPESSD